jgi:hypothetical protein
VDAVIEPIYAETEPDFRGNIDSLYVYGAAGNEFQGQNSGYHHKLCGLRWSDPDPDREQGRIQWFGFPMYYAQKSQAEQVFKKSLDWFREEDNVVPVRLLAFEALRRGESAVVRWAVPEGEEGAMFHVYREEPGTERVRLTLEGLTGQTRYEFVDAAPPSGPVAYWLAERDRTGATAWHGPVQLAGVGIEHRLALAPIQPNPVVSQAQIAYTLAGAGRVTLTVYDVMGRQVATVLDAVQDPGKHTETWRPHALDGSPLAPGFYLIRLEAGGEERVRKVFVLR